MPFYLSIWLNFWNNKICLSLEEITFKLNISRFFFFSLSIFHNFFSVVGIFGYGKVNFLFNFFFGLFLKRKIDIEWMLRMRFFKGVFFFLSFFWMNWYWTRWIMFLTKNISLGSFFNFISMSCCYNGFMWCIWRIFLCCFRLWMFLSSVPLFLSSASIYVVIHGMGLFE